MSSDSIMTQGFVDRLCKAAELGDVECIKTLVQTEHWSEFCKSWRPSGNPVICAALEGHAEVLNILKEAGADLDLALKTLFTLRKNRTVLGKVFLKGSFALLNNGASPGDVNFPYAAIASNFGNLELLTRLLESKAGVDVPLHPRSTALIDASQKGNADIVKCLLRYNADVDYRASDNEWTALMHAVFRGHYHVAKILLIDGKADPNITDLDRTSALFLISPHQDSNGANMAKLLLENGANVNYRNSYKETILLEFLKSSAHNHSYEVSLDLVKVFLEHGWDVNLPNCCGYTPLMYACHLGSQAVEMIELLLSAGANVDAKSRTCEYVRYVTPLAVVMNRTETVRTVTRFELCDILLKHGAMVRNKTNNSVTDHLHIAISKGLNAVVDRMVQAGGLPLSHLYMDMVKQKASLLSPLHASFYFRNSHLIQKFLGINFLRSFDLFPPAEKLVDLRRVVEKGDDPTCLTLFTQVYSQPWSLQTICFVKVSEAVGFRPNRPGKIPQTKLPIPLQKQLKFDVGGGQVSSSVPTLCLTGSNDTIQDHTDDCDGGNDDQDENSIEDETGTGNDEDRHASIDKDIDFAVNPYRNICVYDALNFLNWIPITH